MRGRSTRCRLMRLFRHGLLYSYASQLPSQMTSAAPVKYTTSSADHLTESVPPRVLIETVRPVRPSRAHDTAAAHDPVPDELVHPTPRSQNRTSISLDEIGWMNSTLVRFGNRSFDSIWGATLANALSVTSGTTMLQCGLPIEVHVIS